MTVKFIGLDVHKDTIAVAVADGDGAREVRFHGTMANTPEAIRRLVARLSGPGVVLRFCYEAGACGYGVYRQLRRLGVDCMVVAPSMTPRRPGDRVKTDRRDAMTLARLLRAGELTAVWVPDEEHEAIRDLVRARRQAKDDLVSTKLALRSFLLRHERRFPGRSAWNKTYWRWLGEQAFASPHQQLVFGEHLRRIEEAQARCDRLDAALAEAVAGWRLAPRPPRTRTRPCSYGVKTRPERGRRDAPAVAGSPGASGRRGAATSASSPPTSSPPSVPAPTTPSPWCCRRRRRRPWTCSSPASPRPCPTTCTSRSCSTRLAGMA